MGSKDRMGVVGKIHAVPHPSSPKAWLASAVWAKFKG